MEGIEGIFHVNVNCSNLERSLAFYKMLGFRVVLDMPGAGGAKLDKGLGPRRWARAWRPHGAGR